MAGSNGNSTFEELFGAGEGQIDTSADYRKFEKAISKEGGKEEFEKICSNKSTEVIKAFDSKLTGKVDSAKESFKNKRSSKGNENLSKNVMNSDVESAYLVLGEYQKGKTGSFEELQKNAETEQTLEMTKETLINKINTNADWNDKMKSAAKNAIEDLFKDCNSIEEFEHRAGTRLATIESMDDIGDFFRGIPNFVDKTMQKLDEATWMFLSALALPAEVMCKAGKIAIEKGVIAWNDFVERGKRVGMTMADISKTVCEWGKEQFASFINFLQEKGEDIRDALASAWDFLGKEWNKFVDFCGGVTDIVIKFGLDLVNKGELLWSTLVEGIKSDIDKVVDVCKTLIDAGLVTISQVAEWAQGIGEKGKELILNILEWNVNLWNDFADFCKNSWESMKDFFGTIASELLIKGTIALNTFVSWCKDSWEVVKDVACNVLVGLVKVGKFTLDVVIDVLLAVTVIPAVELSKLLMAAGKEIYKGATEVADFVSNLAVVLRQKAKILGISAVDFLKEFGLQCQEFALMTAKNMEKMFVGLREKMKEFGISAADFIKGTYELVKKSLNNSRNKVADFFKNLGLTVSDIAITLREASKGARQGCVDFVIKSYHSFESAMNVLVNKCKMTIDKIGEFVVTTGKNLVEFMKYVRNIGKMTYENIAKRCQNSQEKITLFIRSAIDKLQVQREELVKWCGGQINKLAKSLKAIYGQTKEGIKNFIKFVGKSTVEAGKLVLKLGIGSVSLVIMALKEAGCALKNVAELCVKYAKTGAKQLCEWLSVAYGRSKDMIVSIGKAVAAALNNSVNEIRDWVYAKTQDVKKAIEATKEYIKNQIAAVAEWMYNKGIAIADICKTLAESFKGEIDLIRNGLEEFMRKCAIKRNGTLDSLKIDNV